MEGKSKHKVNTEIRRWYWVAQGTFVLIFVVSVVMGVLILVSRPSPDQRFANELNSLGGLSGTPFTPSNVHELLRFACPEVAASRKAHTAYADRVLAFVAASGRCGR